MNDIDDILKELKNILSDIEHREIKEKIQTVIKNLKDIQNDIFEDLSSIDVYANPDDIGTILCDVMEKVAYDTYWSNYRNTVPVNDDDI